ncbi:MAG: hypothetical protein KO202_08200 [Methanobacteriaceae archaeon]|jgi:hypothetical protein|nr:hypothetical protein [Methanobacteriaceae archaeon]
MKIEIADDIFIKNKSNLLFIEKYGEEIQISFDEIFISLEDDKPSENELKDKIAEGKIIHLTNNDILEYAYKLGILRDINDDDFKVLSDNFEKHDLFNKISFNHEEIEEIKNIKTYESKLRILFNKSHRFNDIIKYAIQRGLPFNYLVEDILVYLNAYEIENIIVDYIFFDNEKDILDFRNKYEFSNDFKDMTFFKEEDDLIIRKNYNENFFLFDSISSEEIILGEAIILNEYYPFPYFLIRFQRSKNNILKNHLKNTNYTWN